MRKMKSILAILVIAFMLPISVGAANTPKEQSQTAQAKAKIITPITLENTGSQSLDFGTITTGTGSSVILVSAVASPTKTVLSGDAHIIVASTQTAAKFTVGGQSGTAYTITLPTTSTITGGVGVNLTVSDFTCSNGTSGTIGTNDLFYVGGSLTVPSNAVATDYTGTFNVTVAYN
jgi:hypothetical protein